MKASPLQSRKQKLSPKASAAKAARDLIAAKSPYRRAAKAANQARKRANPVKSKGKDWDHKDKKYKSPAKNRGNDGKGTKIEGKENYKA